MGLHYHKVEKSLEDGERNKILSEVTKKVRESRKPGDPIEWLPHAYIAKEGTWKKS